jgi:hypothetical protein
LPYYSLIGNDATRVVANDRERLRKTILGNSEEMDLKDSQESSEMRLQDFQGIYDFTLPHYGLIVKDRSRLCVTPGDCERCWAYPMRWIPGEDLGTSS